MEDYNNRYVQVTEYPKLYIKKRDNDLYEKIIIIMNTQHPNIKLQQLRKLVYKIFIIFFNYKWT